MGSLPHFMSFKKKSKEDTYECLNLIGKERFDEHDIEIHDIITFKEDLLDFKKGKTYVRTYGSSYDHRNKKFLGGIKEIKFNQCSIIYDEVYWVVSS